MKTAILALSAIALPQALAAQSDPFTAPIEESLQGVYVVGDECQAPTAEHRIIGQQADFLLLEAPDKGAREFMATIYSQVPQLDDGRYVFDTGGGDFELVAQNADGSLEVNYTASDAEEMTLSEVMANPDRLALDPEVEHLSRCESYADTVMLPYVELIGFIRSDILPICASGSAEACIQTAFEYLDVHEDEDLRPAEIARGLRIASMLSLGVDQAQGRAEASDVGTIAALMPTYPLLGLAVVGQLDYDGSGGVSLQEVATDLNELPGSLSARIGLDDLDGGGATDAMKSLSMLAKMFAAR